MDAQNAKQQHQAMLDLMERGMALPVMGRMILMADIAAAQLTLNGMVLDELEQVKGRLDLSDQRRAKATDMLMAYLKSAVVSGVVPIDAAEELQRNIEDLEAGE